MNRIIGLGLLTLILLICYPIHICGQSVLWEELSTKEQKVFMAMRDSDCLEIKIYKGERLIDDYPELWEMLERFVKNAKTKEVDPFEFCIFNMICTNADGAVSEPLGEYCMVFCTECPRQVISLFKNNNLYLEKYSNLIGIEIAQQGYSKNMTKKTINTMKRKMMRKITKSDRTLVRALCKEIKNVALSMLE